MSGDTRIAVAPPWLTATAAAAVTEPKKKLRTTRLEAPTAVPTAVSSSSVRVANKHRVPRITWYMWVTWVWLGAVTIVAVFALFMPSHSSPVAPQAPLATNGKKGEESRLNVSSSKNPHHVKVYPFNFYEASSHSPVRYPREGGIPQLDWASVKHFEACCRDDTSIHCFTASELALRRDPARTTLGLTDVYMEISSSSSAWVRVGARCQLIWSTEKADVEGLS